MLVVLERPLVPLGLGQRFPKTEAAAVRPWPSLEKRWRPRQGRAESPKEYLLPLAEDREVLMLLWGAPMYGDWERERK